MTGLASHLTAILAAFSLVFTPMAAQANTRAAESANYANESNNENDDDGAGLLRLGGSSALKNQDWLLILFGAVATAGAIAIVLSSKPDSQGNKQGSSGSNQSNGAT